MMIVVFVVLFSCVGHCLSSSGYHARVGGSWNSAGSCVGSSLSNRKSRVSGVDSFSMARHHVVSGGVGVAGGIGCASGVAGGDYRLADTSFLNDGCGGGCGLHIGLSAHSRSNDHISVDSGNSLSFEGLFRIVHDLSE